MKKESKWNSKGGGMPKHRKSGIAHNHAITIQKVREYNQQQEKFKRMKENQKSKMFEKVEDVFKN